MSIESVSYTNPLDQAPGNDCFLREVHEQADAIANYFEKTLAILPAGSSRKRISRAVNTITAHMKNTSEVSMVTPAYFDPENKSIHAAAHHSRQLTRHVLRHELFHAAARNLTQPSSKLELKLKRDIDRYSKSGRFPNRVVRTGVETNSIGSKISIGDKKHNSKNRRFFASLNEALTQIFVMQSSATVRGKITQWIYEKNPVYRKDRELLTQIITSISQKTGVDAGDVFLHFAYAYTHTWTPELKKLLLKTFGPNALRVLASLNSTLALWGDARVKDLRSFFDVTAPEKIREITAQSLLKRSDIPPLVKNKDGSWSKKQNTLS